MPTNTLDLPVDTRSDEAFPNTNYGDELLLALRADVGSRRYVYLFWGGLPPAGSSVPQAIVKVYLRGTGWAAGPHTITAKLITSNWKEGVLTWNKAPTVSASNTGAAAVTGGVDGQEVQIDVTAMMATIAAGAAWFGIRLEVDTVGAVRQIYSSEAGNKDLRPVLQITFSRYPLPPIDLSPAGGRSVSLSDPTLTWTFRDKDGDAQQAFHVQLDTVNTFNSANLWDSGWITDPAEQLDLSKNLLSKNQSDIETDTSGWVTGLNAPTLARDVTQFFQGIASLKLTATLAADFNATTTTGAGGIPVTVGQTYTAQVRFRPGATARTVHVDINWYTAGGGLISTSAGGNVVEVLGTWVVASVTAVAPATAAFAAIRVYVVAAANAEVHFVDAAMLEPGGAASAWQPGFAGIADAATWFWRVETQDTNGLGSGYSDIQTFRRDIKGALTVNAPPNGGTVEETTPPITTTLATKAQGTIAYTLEEDDGTGTYVEVWRKDRFAAPAGAGVSYSTTPPAGKITRTGRNYRLTVDSWDTIDREATPGDLPRIRQQVVFTFVRSAVPAPVTLLTAAMEANGPGTVLTWNRAIGQAAPDYWALMVDGKRVFDRILPASVIFGAGNPQQYQMVYYGASPKSAHTFEIEAVVTDVGKLKHSQANVTASFTPTPIGLWLVEDENTQTPNKVRILAEEPAGLSLGESGETFYPIGRQDPVRIVDSLRGFEGSVAGVIRADDPAGAAFVANLRRMKKKIGKTVRLIAGAESIPVILGPVDLAPTPAPETAEYAVTVQVMQVAEFA